MPMDFKDVGTEVTRTRIWFGFPHYVVLGWALLISWQLYELRAWRDGFVEANTRAIAGLIESVDELRGATDALQRDGIRTRTILELRFPRTAKKIEDALSGIQE